MENYFFYASTLILAPITTLIVFNYKSIVNFAIKSLQYNPGEGEIYKKSNFKTKVKNYYIKNPDHHFRLNYIKSPFFDMVIGFFIKDIDIKYNMMVSRDYFQTKYKDQEFYKLFNHGMGFIDDIYETKNIKKGNLYGFMKCLTEDKIYLFVMEPGKIDLHKLFKDYEDELLNGID